MNVAPLVKTVWCCGSSETMYCDCPVQRPSSIFACFFSTINPWRPLAPFLKGRLERSRQMCSFLPCSGAAAPKLFELPPGPPPTAFSRVGSVYASLTGHCSATTPLDQLPWLQTACLRDVIVPWPRAGPRRDRSPLASALSELNFRVRHYRTCLLSQQTNSGTATPIFSPDKALVDGHVGGFNRGHTFQETEPVDGNRNSVPHSGRL